MRKSKTRQEVPSPKPDSNRHKAHCSICAHPQCEEIEREFVSWKSPAKIAEEFGLPDRSAVYRHANALDLHSKRARNLHAALDRAIEQVDNVKWTPGAIVQAIALRARINSRGELVEYDEQVRIHDLFEQMTPQEYEAYARESALPSWFPRLKGAKVPQDAEGEND